MVLESTVIWFELIGLSLFLISLSLSFSLSLCVILSLFCYSLSLSLFFSFWSGSFFSLDNSEWMRNGDYVPTRLEAQQDAASLICSARTDSHPENTVGLLTMAGKGVSMLVSPTENIGKILAAFSGIACSGETQFSTSVQIAQLALKHRKNKNGGQRVIIFVGSPIKEDIKALQKLGLLLKKNNIAVDVVVMGEHNEIQEKLSEFVKSANSSDNSHLIVVPPGVAPSDALISSPIFQGDDGGLAQAMAASTGGGDGGGQFAEYGGVNPDLDPELAMALRLSAEEARAHEEFQARIVTEESKTQNEEIPSLDEDEDAILQAALAMSLGGDPQPQEQVDDPNEGEEEQRYIYEEGEDDDELQMALQLSMGAGGENEAEPSQPPSTTNEIPSDLMNSDFVNELLGSVGVDQNDPLVRAALEQLAQSQSGGTKDENKSNENENKRKRDEDR